MTDSTDDTFTTDGSPGEQAFESTVDDAVGFFETAFDTSEYGYGPRTSGVLRSCVRAALTTDGTASPETVTDAARTLGGQDGLASDERVEPVLRRIEEMIDESISETDTDSDSGGI
jgi:hypothetical protein